jgi:CheY-like chemotaxis protein
VAGGLWNTMVDPGQVENAVLNLAINARDAMRGQGQLTIEASNVVLDDIYARLHPEATPGEYVMLAVTDTGSGMAPEIRAKVFEPFFTTKPEGQGTGLGLSMVYGFVRQSGGHLRIDSEPEVGTRIEILLPCMTGDTWDVEEEVIKAGPRGGCDETILVCEDDDDVRTYTTEILAELGYDVLEAADGPSTLRLLAEHGRRVDLLFTDVVLPGGMSGAEVAEEARRMLPGLKVLFTTGYARDAIVHEGRLDPGVEVITKPFDFADLANRLREVLDR